MCARRVEGSRLQEACAKVTTEVKVNVNAILFLQASDLTHFAKVQNFYPGARRLFIDPGLIEVAVREGVELEPFSFVPPEFDLHFQARVANEASIRAAHLDLALTKVRVEVFGQGVFQGWDQSLLRQFFLRATLFRELGKLCDAQFAPGQVGLLRPQNPQLFYFDSFVAMEMFSSSSNRWHIIEDYEAAALWRDDAYSKIFDSETIGILLSKGVNAVAHLPATYRHIAECLPQIKDRFPRIIDLPSVFWDVPVSRDGDMPPFHADLYSKLIPEKCKIYRERALSIIEEHLNGFMSNRRGLSLQAALFADRALMQSVNFFTLRDALKGSKPHFLLTDHDAGNNGPLFSVAQCLGSKITVIPHSSYVTGVIPHAEQVEVIERNGFKTPVRTALGEYIPTRGVRFGREVKKRSRMRIKTVCLLLNGIVSNGLFHLDFVGVTKFFAALNEICTRNEIRLVIRLKPSASGLGLISGALGVESSFLEEMLKPSIEEVAESADLCVSFGQPTSAMINFLDAGCFLLHVGRQHWPSDFAWAPAFVGDGTVSSYLPVEALAFIERLIAKDLDFQDVLIRQNRQFQERLFNDQEIFPGDINIAAFDVQKEVSTATADEYQFIRPTAAQSGSASSVEIGGRQAQAAKAVSPDPRLWAAALAAIPRPFSSFNTGQRFPLQ